MRIIEVDHPLVAHKLTVLRDKETASPIFRQLAEELMTLLAYEATRDVRVVEKEIETPVTKTTGIAFQKPTPLVVPILRAGLGMLEGMVKLVPTAEVGFLGMARDEETLEAITYAERLPQDLTGRQVFMLDPMLATGGTLIEAVKFAFDRGADDVTCVCLLAAPEGLKKLEKALEKYGDKMTIVLGSIDEKLNDKSYIVPGLGDAGDRLYGVAE
ncbi:MAG: uracil phosphoribosyltransferase [Micrococcaceae bacterium]